MNLDRKTLLANMIVLFISMITSYIFYWAISLRIIDSLYNLDTALKGVFLYLCHFEIFYLLMKIISKLKIYSFEKMLLITYFILILMLFFDRVYVGRRILNYHVLDIMNSIHASGTSTLILNILAFCPFYTAIKWIHKEASFKSITLLFVLLSVSIEILQYITMCGIFDVVDIILYFLGYFIGVIIYKFIFI